MCKINNRFVCEGRPRCATRQQLVGKNAEAPPVTESSCGLSVPRRLFVLILEFQFNTPDVVPEQLRCLQF